MQLSGLHVEFITFAAVVGNRQTDGRRHQCRPLAAVSVVQGGYMLLGTPHPCNHKTSQRKLVKPHPSEFAASLC